MTAPDALARAELAGRLARDRGTQLAQRRDHEHPFSGWHPLAIIAAGVVAGALCGRMFGRPTPAAAATSLAVPLLAWLQAGPAAALRGWIRRERAAARAAAAGASNQDRQEQAR